MPEVHRRNKQQSTYYGKKGASPAKKGSSETGPRNHEDLTRSLARSIRFRKTSDQEGGALSASCFGQQKRFQECLGLQNHVTHKSSRAGGTPFERKKELVAQAESLLRGPGKGRSG